MSRFYQVKIYIAVSNDEVKEKALAGPMSVTKPGEGPYKVVRYMHNR